MTRLFHLMTIAAVSAVALPAAAQQKPKTPAPASSSASSAITVTGCLERSPAMGTGSEMTRVGDGSATTESSTATRPQDGTHPPHNTPTPPQGSATAVQGTTTHPGQPGSPHANAAQQTSAQAGPGYILRVAAKGMTGATPRTGMPSSSAGMSDARLEAGTIGTTIYNLKAGGSVNLAAHLNHTVEITGRAMHDAAPATASVRSRDARGGAMQEAARQDSAAPSPVASGKASPTQSPSQAGTSGAASPATGAMPTVDARIDGGWLEVTGVKMVAASCK